MQNRDRRIEHILTALGGLVKWRHEAKRKRTHRHRQQCGDCGGGVNGGGRVYKKDKW